MQQHAQYTLLIVALTLLAVTAVLFSTGRIAFTTQPATAQPDISDYLPRAVREMPLARRAGNDAISNIIARSE